VVVGLLYYPCPAAIPISNMLPELYVPAAPPIALLAFGAIPYYFFNLYLLS